MFDKPTYITDLLAQYHGRPGERSVAFCCDSDRNRTYLISCGLGPITHQLLVDSTGAPATQGDDLTFRSAHLTALIIYRQMERTTNEILQLGAMAGVDIVLLKGISIATQLYKSPHHRVMGDIDILVRLEDAARFNGLLVSRGYLHRPASDRVTTPKNHHHLPELLHPDTGVAIEIHTSLMSRTRLADDSLMKAQVFQGAIRSSTFAGKSCQRFSIEYQIAYTLMHWATDHKWATNVISINDFIHLVNIKDQEVDWGQIASWMDQSPMFAETFTVLALYLAKSDIVRVPDALAESVRSSCKSVGRVNLLILHWLLHTFPLSGSRVLSGLLTPLNTHIAIVWLALLEPRHKALRPIIALARVARSVAGSLANRVRSLFQRSD